jgi:hypothetical protein
MQRYILTERGKFLVAILVIVIFLLLPAMIIAIWALTREAETTHLPPDTNGIYQNGTGSFSPEPPPIDTPDPSLNLPNDDNNESTHPDTSLDDLVAFDLEAGTMTFLFTPNQQDALDSNVDTKLGELLTSLKNTNNAKIAVDIPQLPDTDTAILTTAILDAFTKHEVPLGDIVFFVYQPDPDVQTFEIHISFQ